LKGETTRNQIPEHRTPNGEMASGAGVGQGRRTVLCVLNTTLLWKVSL